MTQKCLAGFECIMIIKEYCSPILYVHTLLTKLEFCLHMIMNILLLFVYILISNRKRKEIKFCFLPS